MQCKAVVITSLVEQYILYNELCIKLDESFEYLFDAYKQPTTVLAQNKWSETLAHSLLAQSNCIYMPRGTASPQPLRISWSLAMAEFYVKSFALFMW